MASVFKRSRDRQRRGGSWYVAYTDEFGVRRTVKGCPDRAATEALSRKLESEAELRRRGVIDPRIDGYSIHESRPLAEHLADFKAFLIGKGNTSQHANLTHNRIKRILDLTNARRVSELTLSRVQSALKTIRDKGASLRSVHHTCARPRHSIDGSGETGARVKTDSPT